MSAAARRRRYVLVVPDGAADLLRTPAGSPLEAARTPYMDFLAHEGVSGLMRTLYPELPRESLVAQMGMLGWDPREHYPGGRASCELLALEGVHLEDGDLAFRANLARVEGRTLASYNADFIHTHEAVPLVERVNRALGDEFPEFELRHASDFRSALVLRGVGVRPDQLVCAEPHECHGVQFPPGSAVRGRDAAGEAVAARMGRYMERVREVLAGQRANAVFPWSPSTALRLPSFRERSGFTGRAAVVGAMDFLCGLARAGGMEFHSVGNGRPDTDYAAKGRKTVELLAAGCEVVVCHVNAPDEAAHMQDPELKVRCIERTDAEVVGPVVEFFRARPQELGGVMVIPDHYTNCSPDAGPVARSSVHSLHPVPFALWNGRDRDAVSRFGEDAAAEGLLAGAGLTHLDLLALLRAGVEEPARVTVGLPRVAGRVAHTDCR
ncbi:MAG TPA: hypothetical protein VHG51_08700 [Longimicrobiaceae bacterium]|nr:hypothetical protein [Longimicrobiaceae bacterium]